jgi:hypothetical protein
MTDTSSLLAQPVRWKSLWVPTLAICLPDKCHLQPMLIFTWGNDVSSVLCTQALAAFSGGGWEQEDDLTIVTVHRLASAPEA